MAPQILSMGGKGSKVSWVPTVGSPSMPAGRGHRSVVQNNSKGRLPRQVNRWELQLGLGESAAPGTAEGKQQSSKWKRSLGALSMHGTPTGIQQEQKPPPTTQRLGEIKGLSPKGR